MVYPSLFLYFFPWLVFPCSNLVGGAIPTSPLVFAETVLLHFIYIYIFYVCLDHRANLCQVQNGQNGCPLHSHCVRLKYSPRIAANKKEIVWNEVDTPTSPQAKIQASEEGIMPTNLPPCSRISQDPKQSSLQSLDSQVKWYTKRTRLQRHLPVSILNSAVAHLNFANILLCLLWSTSTHRALATFIVH